MYKVVRWTPDIDLTEFYASAERRGFENNASQTAMIDCFNEEREWAAWVLYQHNKIVGFVAAHSFDLFGVGGCRVLARTCAFGDARPNYGLTTLNRMIVQHQHLTDQFLLPACLEWAGDREVFASSNESDVASQQLVHKHYFPTLERMGIVTKVMDDVFYRKTFQTFWRIDGERFLANLSRYPRWTNYLPE